MDAIDTLTALSPLDGRYASKLEALRPVFSEFGLVKRRVEVEIAWLETLCDAFVASLSEDERKVLRDIAKSFSDDDARRVKDIEVVTNHDVKAVEYFIKEKMADTPLARLSEFVHFACTSEDINNVAYALMLRDGLTVIRAEQQKLIDALAALAADTRNMPMLAHTHGQPASPTTLGKEMAVFAHRLNRQSEQLDTIKLLAKMNGAIGCYNAHAFAYPKVNWMELTRSLIEDRFGLSQNALTTQIEPHDGMAELFDALARWNTVLIDLNRDIWAYISLDYFGQKTVSGEIGSSIMPHKVNPIDFENSEGNLGLANAVLGHLARKLPISRLQRDLTDSTVLRSIGVAFGYSLVAYQSTFKGLGKICVNRERLAEDLEDAWEVLAEPIQTIMRKHGKPNPYEQLKELTRGKRITPEIMRQFIQSLDIPDADKTCLLELTPAKYIGLASELAIADYASGIARNDAKFIKEDISRSKQPAKDEKYKRKKAQMFYQIGLLYANGQGVDKNETKAVQWFAKAAELENVNAQFELGGMYAWGCGDSVKKNATEAAKWFGKAAKQGHADANFCLGFMYLTGDGVGKDDVKASTFFIKAAKLGNINVQRSLHFIVNGHNISQDNTKTVKQKKPNQ